MADYVDGWWGGERELTVIPEPRFPFRQNVSPDIYSRAYEREYLVTPRQFVPRIDLRTSWTNVAKYSEALDESSAWTLTNATVLPDVATAPDGLGTMEALKETSANGEHAIAQTLSATNAPWEFMIFARRGLNRDFIRVAFTDSAAATFSVFFDLAGGVVGTAAGGAVGKILRLGRGNFACIVQCTPAAGSGTFKINLASGPSTISYAGSSANGMYLWGAQAAAGADVPYISTTDAGRTIVAPDRDPLDPFAFLIRESDPVVTNSEMLKVRRGFARIPIPQTRPSSQWVKKPDLTGTFPQESGNSITVQPEPGVPRWVFFTRIPIASDSGIPAVTITGGTYTLSFSGDTTVPIAYNASAATVQAALNALSTVVGAGGVTVSGSNTAGFTVVFGSLVNTAANTSSLGSSFSTISSSIAAANGGQVQTVAIRANWNPANPVFASSLTPVNANPIEWSLAGATKIELSFIRGNNFLYGALATGGTFTLTLFGDTTAALNHDASFATIASAVNGLAGVVARGLTYDVRTAGINGVPAVGVFTAQLPAITSGTFTLTVLGQTTSAIAYNASLATIQAAINALSNVSARGGVIVSGAGFANGEINFVISFANLNGLSGNPASLVPSGSSMAVASAGGDGRTQTISFTVLPSTVRTLIAGAHGIVATDSILLSIDGATFVTLSPGSFAVPDGSTIQLLPASGLVNRAGTFTAVGKQNGNFYTAEAKYTRTKRITTFYLVGVSPGIADIDDIPLPAYEGDPASLLAAIFGGATTLNLEVGELELYEDGPIVQRTVVTIDPSTL
jgi:hypothetical protein